MNSIPTCRTADIFSTPLMDDRAAAMAMMMGPLHPSTQPMMASSLINPSYPIMLTGWTSTVPSSGTMAPSPWGGMVGEGGSSGSSFPMPYFPPRKTRRRLSASESRLLNAAFEMHPHPSAEVRAKLEKQLGMSRRAVQIWFQNKRAKRRRIEKDGAKEPLHLLGCDDDHYERGDGGSDSLLVYAPMVVPTMTMKPSTSIASPGSLCFEELNSSLADDLFLSALSKDMELLSSCNAGDLFA